MATDSENLCEALKHGADIIDKLAKELLELYEFRNLFFENHPVEKASEKNKLVEEKRNALIEKFDNVDVGTEIPPSLRAQYLYLQGRCFNITPTQDHRAIQCLSKAVKLNPRLIDAWNELGEAYWKSTNIKEAKASFEGALKHKRDSLTLRSLSIILRQESGDKSTNEVKAAILKSIDLAKEAVSQDIKDGISWTVLGNAYLCQFFQLSQDPAVLKLCLSAYRQANQDPIARGQPDLYYNKGIALKYAELYDEALDSFEYATRLDPPWDPPRDELTNLTNYLTAAHDIVRTKGKIKTKKVTQMVQSIDMKMLGPLGTAENPAEGEKQKPLVLTTLDNLKVGVDANKGTVILGRVVGSIQNNTSVPFTFAMVDESMDCVLVTVYNWAMGRGVIIGDCVAIPEPAYKALHRDRPPQYSFKSIRVNNPLSLVVNGKRITHTQFASTKVSSSYETH